MVRKLKNYVVKKYRENEWRSVPRAHLHRQRLER